ncbi:hypothetical protein KRMM14A1259_48300 [Krasilnikovia sp. MM14-A1259]
MHLFGCAIFPAPPDTVVASAQARPWAPRTKIRGRPRERHGDAFDGIGSRAKGLAVYRAGFPASPFYKAAGQDNAPPAHRNQNPRAPPQWDARTAGAGSLSGAAEVRKRRPSTGR